MSKFEKDLFGYKIRKTLKKSEGKKVLYNGTWYKLPDESEKGEDDYLKNVLIEEWER